MKISRISVIEQIKIKDLFDKLSIKFDDEKKDVIVKNEYNIKINTSIGYKEIESFRLVKPEIPVTIYLKNKMTLKGSENHFVKTLNRGWVKLKDLEQLDFVETKGGFSEFFHIKYWKKEEELYDFQVKEIHSYYTNDINSHNSYTLVNFACGGVASGKNVLYYSMELSQYNLGLRADAYFSGFKIDDITNERETVKEKLIQKRNGMGKFIIRRFPTKSKTVSQLKSYTNRLIATGFRPDLVVVDYGDLIKPSNATDEKRIAVESIYEELRQWAGEDGYPCWTASQSNRSSLSKDYISIEDFAESFNKAMVADVIIGQTRSPVQKLQNEATFYLAKSRVGSDGIFFEGIFDTAYNKIEIVEVSDDRVRELSGHGKDGKKVKISGEEKNHLKSFLKGARNECAS